MGLLPSPFGQPCNNPSIFGQTNNANTNIFGTGSTIPPSGGSSISFGTNTAFGLPIIGQVNNANTNAFRTGPSGSFGTSAASESSAFGLSFNRSNANTNAFGTGGSSLLGGTAYTATNIVESDNESGKLQSISAMPNYSDKSHEELRIESFNSGKNAFGRPVSTFGVPSAFVQSTNSQFGGTETGLNSNNHFGINSGSNLVSGDTTSSVFRGPFPYFDVNSGPFIASSSPSFRGNQATASAFGTTGFAFSNQRKGSRKLAYSEIYDTKFQSISAMPAYKDKSHEELRLEDYNTGDRGETHAFAWPFSHQTTCSPFSSQTSSGLFSSQTASFFSQNSCIFSPQTSTSGPFPNQSSSSPLSNQGCLGFLSPETTSSFSTPTSFNLFDNPYFFQPQKIPTNNLFSPKDSTSPFVPQTPFNGFTNFTSPSTFSSFSFLGISNPISSPTLFPPTTFLSPSLSVSSPVFKICTHCSSFSNSTPELESPSAPYFAPSSPVSSTNTDASAQSPSLSTLWHSAPSVQTTNLPAKAETTGPNTSSEEPGSQSTVVDEPVVKTNPFGELPAIANLSISGPGSTISLQYGISSMPDKPSAPVRLSSSLTSRHVSHHRMRLPVRKYDSKSQGPKVPFFGKDEGLPVRASSLVPRENPRAFVVLLDELWPHSSDEREEIAPEVTKSLHGNENGVSSENKAISKEPNNILNIDVTVYESESNEPKISEELTDEIETLLPQLSLPDYYTEPSINQLQEKEKVEPGFCSRVNDFVIGRCGYGKIIFLGETDVTKLCLDSIVEFDNREVVVYKNENEKPSVGKGLNKLAEVTLFNIQCVDKKTGERYIQGPKVDKYKEMLMKRGEEQGVEFISFDPAKGEWKFRVQHF